MKPHCNTEVLNRNCASCEVRGGVCCYFSQYLTVSASNLVCVLFFFTQYIGFILTYQHIGSAICAHSLVGLCVREPFLIIIVIAHVLD